MTPSERARRFSATAVFLFGAAILSWTACPGTGNAGARPQKRHQKAAGDPDVDVRARLPVEPSGEMHSFVATRPEALLARRLPGGVKRMDDFGSPVRA